MTRFRLIRVAGLALSLSLVAAACGDDDDTDTSADAPVEETSEDMGDESAAPVDSAEACDADAIVAAVEGGPDEGTLAGMTDDPVGTAASSNPVLTTLVTAVTEAELVDTLNSAEALTVFAPTDCAFAALDPATLEAALADPSGLLTQVLGFHVIAGERLSSEDLAGMTELTTFTDETLEISADGGTVSVGGGQANVVVPDIQTANATVHLIDSVMLPPSAG
ncbi:MAG TPA: beta-Ig-H3/fasciclin [Acidimicrobiaceae bacterium]|nr:beta-Ig-H3/fasciclin [Acidimicrobiaceae bacterium]